MELFTCVTERNKLGIAKTLFLHDRTYIIRGNFGEIEKLKKSNGFEKKTKSFKNTW